MRRNQAGEGAAVLERPREETFMARWPRHKWTTLYTYLAVFVLFPVCCLLAYAWVSGWRF